MDLALLDVAGYRLGVGMVILNADNQVLWACRVQQHNAWQFPQGGLHGEETPQQAMYRELSEEVGLTASDIAIITESQHWYSYSLPPGSSPIEGRVVNGQKQKWFLLRLLVSDQQINLNAVVPAEFSQWRWVDYWYPVEHIVAFKREVYYQVLTEFARFINE